MAYFERMPAELKAIVLKALRPAERLRAAQACRALRVLVWGPGEASVAALTGAPAGLLRGAAGPQPRGGRIRSPLDLCTRILRSPTPHAEALRGEIQWLAASLAKEPEWDFRGSIAARLLLDLAPIDALPVLLRHVQSPDALAALALECRGDWRRQATFCAGLCAKGGLPAGVRVRCMLDGAQSPPCMVLQACARGVAPEGAFAAAVRSLVNHGGWRGSGDLTDVSARDLRRAIECLPGPGPPGQPPHPFALAAMDCPSERALHVAPDSRAGGALLACLPALPLALVGRMSSNQQRGFIAHLVRAPAAPAWTASYLEAARATLDVAVPHYGDVLLAVLREDVHAWTLRVPTLVPCGYAERVGELALQCDDVLTLTRLPGNVVRTNPDAWALRALAHRAAACLHAVPRGRLSPETRRLLDECEWARALLAWGTAAHFRPAVR
jgi:hypothetical protein